MKLTIFQNVIHLVDFTSGFWASGLQLSLRNIPKDVRLRLFDSALKASATAERWLPEFVFHSVQEQRLDAGHLDPDTSFLYSTDSKSMFSQVKFVYFCLFLLLLMMNTFL